MRKMTEEEILTKFKAKEINSEEALEALTHLGCAPNLLYDDNGHWAISSMGMQNVPEGDEPEDMNMVVFIEAKSWKDTIYEAILFYLESED